MSEKTRYNDFGVFMESVLQTAKTKHEGLADLYHAPMNVVLLLIQILARGWWVFLGLSVALGFGFFGFLAFLANPIGLIVAAIAGVAIWNIYRSKELVGAIKEIGEIFKPTWEENVKANSPAAVFDKLHDTAVLALLMTPLQYKKSGVEWVDKGTDAYMEWYRKNITK